jgi:hypothetical protein
MDLVKDLDAAGATSCDDDSEELLTAPTDFWLTSPTDIEKSGGGVLAPCTCGL